MITEPLDRTCLTPIYAGVHIQGAEYAPYTLVEYATTCTVIAHECARDY
jgi:hypothetical protein